MKLYTLFTLQVLLISLYAAKVDDERWQILNKHGKRPTKSKNNVEYDDDADFYRRFDINNYEDISTNAIEAADRDLLLDSAGITYTDYSEKDFPGVNDTKGVQIEVSQKNNKKKQVDKLKKSVMNANNANNNNAKAAQKLSELVKLKSKGVGADQRQIKANNKNGLLDSKVVRKPNVTENVKANTARPTMILTRAGQVKKSKLYFSFNLQCTMSDVLCFIVNWNDTISMLLRHPLFSECFRLKQAMHKPEENQFELLNTLKQLSKVEFIDYFLETVQQGSIINEKTQHEHLHSNCSKVNVNNFHGANLNKIIADLPANRNKSAEELDLNEKLKLANALNEQLNCEQNATGLDAQIESLRKRIIQIAPIFDFKNGTGSDNKNTTTSLAPTVKDVQDLILLSQKQIKCNDLCCDRCLSGLQTLRTSANNTIHQLHKWATDSFKELVNWYDSNSQKLKELQEATKNERKRNDKNQDNLKAIERRVHDLGNNQEAFKVETVACCKNFDVALADNNEKLTKARDLQRDENERLNKQIDSLKNSLDELAKANANQVKDTAAELEKLKNLADQLKQLADAFKRSDEDNKNEIRSRTTTLERLKSNLTETIDNPKYKREFDEQLKALNNELNKLKDESAANENTLQNKINELEANLKNASETITGNQQQMQQKQAKENEAQTKQYEKLQDTIGELQNNTMKTLADKLVNMEEQIRNVSQQQTECCTKMDERINDIMNQIKMQEADLKRMQESLNRDRKAKDEQTAKVQEDATKWNERFENMTKNMAAIKSLCETETDNLKAKLEDLTKNLVNEAKLNETLQSCYDKLEQLRNEYEKEIAGLKAANESATKRIDSLEKQLAEVSSSKANSNDDDLNALKARLDHLEANACKNCEATNAKLQEQVNHLEKRVDELEQKLANMGNKDNNNNNVNDSQSCGEVQMEINEDLNQRMFILEQNYGSGKQNEKLSYKEHPPQRTSNKPTKYPARNFKRDQKLGMYFNEVV